MGCVGVLEIVTGFGLIRKKEEKRGDVAYEHGMRRTGGSVLKD